MNCPLCDMLTLELRDRADPNAYDPIIALVGAAYLGWTLGADGFKRALCDEHRHALTSLLVRAGVIARRAASDDLPLGVATCDWGDCDKPVVALRKDRWGHGWLPVCIECAALADADGQSASIHLLALDGRPTTLDRLRKGVQ